MATEPGSVLVYFAVIVSRRIFDSSAGLSTGGWQAKFVQTIATDFFSFSAGRFGTVSASTGGRFCATASLSVRCTTDLLTAKGAIAACKSAAALASSPTTTTCVCGCDVQVAAIP